MNPQNPQQPQEPHHWAPGQNPFYTEPLPGSAQPQNPNAPVQQPEVYNSPSLANIPYGAQPVPQAQGVVGAPVQTAKSSGPNKLLIVAIAGVVLVVILGVIALLLSGSDTQKAKQPNDQTDTSQAESIQPAQALDVQQAGNAISQDLSDLDDEKDFPANALDSKALNL